jgi:hypothetical protein
MQRLQGRGAVVFCAVLSCVFMTADNYGAKKQGAFTFDDY